MIYFHKVVHTDLHNGNILYDIINNKLHIYLIDFGLVTKTNNTIREGLLNININIMKYAEEKNVEYISNLIDNIFKINYDLNKEFKNKELIKEKIKYYFTNVNNLKYTEQGELDIDNSIQVIFEQFQENKIKISAQLTLCILGKSLIIDNTQSYVYNDETLDTHSISKYLRATDCFPLIKNLYSKVNVDIINIEKYIKSLKINFATNNNL